MTVLWEREGKYYGEISSLVNSVRVSVIREHYRKNMEVRVLNLVSDEENVRNQEDIKGRVQYVTARGVWSLGKKEDYI